MLRSMLSVFVVVVSMFSPLLVKQPAGCASPVWPVSRQKATAWLRYRARPWHRLRGAPESLARRTRGFAA
jgi:hypothetical protein